MNSTFIMEINSKVVRDVIAGTIKQNHPEVLMFTESTPDEEVREHYVVLPYKSRNTAETDERAVRKYIYHIHYYPDKADSRYYSSICDAGDDLLVLLSSINLGDGYPIYSGTIRTEIVDDHLLTTVSYTVTVKRELKGAEQMESLSKKTHVKERLNWQEGLL